MSDLFRQEVLADPSKRLEGRIVLQLPLSTKLLAFGLFATIAVALAWVATGEYARMQTVRGILVTTEPSVKIVPQRSGRLDHFTLQEGQKVEAGQILAVINTDIVSERGTATADAASQAVGRRLDLAIQSAGHSQQNALTERTSLQAQIASMTRQIDDLANQTGLQAEIVDSNRQIFERIAPIMDQGFVSRVEFERRRQNLLVSEQSLSRLRQDLDRLKSDRSMARSRMAQLDVVTRQQLSEIESTMAQLDLEKAQYEGERSYQIRSPISGRVSAVQAAEGRYVTGGTPLLVIVPEKANLRANLYAPSAAIGMLKQGQETNLLLDAFPYQRFGSVEGRIAAISRTVLDPRDADIPFKVEEPVYQIEAELTQQSIEAFGEEVPFQPGMTLSANIVLEKQTFLDWLLTPLRAVLNRN